MLRLYKRPRDATWKIRGTLHGRSYEESTGFADRTQAEVILNARVAELDRQRLEEKVLGRRPSPSFAEAVVKYLQKGGERRFLAPLLEYFGKRRIDTITQDDIDDAAIKLCPNCALSTRNRRIYTPMSAVLKASGMPLKMRRPKEPEGRVRWLSPEEAQTLLDCCAPHLRPIVAFLLATGARIGEALYLDWRCVDLERAHVTFPKTKNGKPRGVYLKPEIVAMLANMPHRKGEVFRRRDGKPYTRQDPDDEMNRSGARRIKTGFDGACRRAGIEDFHPHDCRHTWATWHYEKNRDLIGLMHDGGWQSLRMVQRYAHVNLEHRRAAFEALPKLKIG